MTTRSSARFLPAAAGPVLLALLGLGFALVPLARGDLFFYWDNAQQHYPQTEFLHRSLQQGHFPQWWPAVGLGFPFVAEGQAAQFHPVRLALAWLLPPAWAFMIEIGVYLAVAGVGTYLFLRTFRLHAVACLVGGLSQMYGSFSMVFVRNMALHRSFCLLPLAMLCAEKLVTQDRAGAALGMSLVIGLQLLAGHPTFAMVTGVATSVYALCRLGQRAWARGDALPSVARAAVRPLALWLGAAMLGGALAAVQVIPTLELVEHSIRQGGLAFEYATRVLASTPGDLPQLLFPYAYTQGDWLDAPSRWTGVYNLVASSGIYVGVLPVVAGFAALRWSRRWPDPAWPLALCAVVATAFALGAKTPLHPALWSLPGMNGMRYPDRFLMWAGFCVACLGGVGTHRLLALGRLRHRRIGARPWLPLLGVIAALAGAFWLRRPAFHWGVLTSLAWFTGAFTLVAATLVLRRRHRPWLFVALVAFVMGDLQFFRGHGRYARLLPAKEVLAAPSAAQALYRDTTRYRVLSLVSAEGGWNRPQDLRAFLQGDLSSIWGIETADAWFSLLLRRHYIVREGVVSELVRDPAAAPRLSGFLGALGIKYVLSPDTVHLAGWTRFHEADGVTTWENPQAPRSAFLVWRAVPESVVVRPEWVGRARERVRPYLAMVAEQPALDSEIQIVDNILARDLDYRTTATVGGHAPFTESAPDPEALVQALEGDPNALAFAVTSRTPALLVIATSFHPGWSAIVNGRPVPVYRTNWLGMGVPVPSGHSSVDLRFVTPGMHPGLAISLAAMAFWTTGAVLVARRRRRPVPAGREAQP